MEDFPAAHSMDSEWFAVDANGHVAVFDTGEGGPMPAIFTDMYYGYGLFYSIAEKFPYYLDDLLVNPDYEMYQLRWSESQERRRPSFYLRGKADPEIYEQDELYDVLLWLENEDCLQRTDVQKYFKRLNVPGHVVVHGELAAAETVLDLQYRELIRKGWTNYRLEYWRFGFWVYEHSRCEPEFPYEQVAAPETNHHISAEKMMEVSNCEIVPVPLAAVDFSVQPEIRLLELMKCRTWGSLPE